MASKLNPLQSKAAEVSKFAVKNGCTYYKQLLEQNKQYIQDPPTVEKCQSLANQLFYTRLASIPGRYEALWKELDCVKQLFKNRQELKTEDAGIIALFGLECFAWFCAAIQSSTMPYELLFESNLETCLPNPQQQRRNLGVDSYSSSVASDSRDLMEDFFSKPVSISITTTTTTNRPCNVRIANRVGLWVQNPGTMMHSTELTATIITPEMR
ncbi:unnamed protein product [Camellia sinensis]